MTENKLSIIKKPELNSPRMLTGFSGWMNSGEVSTGTADWLIEYLDAEKFAEISPEGFYICNLPGSMEMAAMFRPHAKIEQGLITSYKTPTNRFYYDKKNNLVIFDGKEPNLNWNEFAGSIFEICSMLGVKEIFFIGSVAGLTPHTRDPRILCSVSDGSLRKKLAEFGVMFTEYEGPAGFSTQLMVESAKRNILMSSFVATVPAYIQGDNPRCIEAMLKNLKVILSLDIELADLREMSDEFERKLTLALEDMPELTETIQKLEEDYDKEIFELQMTDLQDWLHQKGIRLD